MNTQTATATTPVPVNAITDWSEVPGSNTYFRTSDVTPFVDEAGQLNVYNSRGNSRSWGTPSVSSDVRTLTPDVVQVTVTGWHKHTVSPVGGNFYFVNEGGRWTRRTANSKAVKAALAATVC